jgi:hypothetical protein
MSITKRVKVRVQTNEYDYILDISKAMKKRVGLYISGSGKCSGRSITPASVLATAENFTGRGIRKDTPSGERAATPTYTRLTPILTRLTKGDRSTAEAGAFKYGLEYYQIIF